MPMPSISTTINPSSARACAIPARGRKVPAAHAAGLRAGIDVVDDRILLGWIEVYVGLNIKP